MVDIIFVIFSGYFLNLIQGTFFFIQRILCFLIINISYLINRLVNYINKNFVIISIWSFKERGNRVKLCEASSASLHRVSPNFKYL